MSEDTCGCYFCYRSVQKTETWLGPPKLNYKKYIARREIPTSRREESALFTMCYADAHAAIMMSTCNELPRGSWGTGVVWRVMTVRPVRYNKKQQGTVPGSEATFLSPCHMFYNPPRPIALSHRIPCTPCRAAMAPWLLRHPRCPKRAQ